MYQPNQPMGVPPPQPASSNRSTIIVVVLVALLFIFLTAIIAGGLGYWIGSRPSAEQAENTKNVNTTAPVPAPTAVGSATPSATPTPTPTPTPDVGGKYTGPTGDVEISNVTDKSFDFNIGVGNSNGSGQIDGQAARTSPTMAVYSKIPDPDLYNDPDSEYYHKKCRITFRFNGAKLAVSEDDFACSYWHGAAVDFNGTFTHKGK